MSSNNAWDDEVLKERAKLFAQRNPHPPMPRWKMAALTMLSLAALLLLCQAAQLLIGG